MKTPQQLKKEGFDIKSMAVINDKVSSFIAIHNSSTVFGYWEKTKYIIINAS